MSEAKTGESTTQSALFPLYLYSEGLFGPERRVNISEEYLALMQTIAGESATPEAIFHFIYAALHSPAYRSRYGAFLKTDFPRVPMPISPAHFAKLAEVGRMLVALHTLDAAGAPVLLKSRFAFRAGTGDNTVVKIEHDGASGFLGFNASRGWENVPVGVYEFKIGGYQVARKWLDDRKGRVLSHTDLKHFGRVLVALDETRRLMLEIDAIGVVNLDT